MNSPFSSKVLLHIFRLKTFLILFIVIGITSFQSFSQVEPHAIGFRGGANTYGSGAEISYQHGLGSENRLEVDLGWNANKNYNNTYFAVIYHWVFNIEGGFNWFVGPGGVVGLHADRRFDGKDNDGITVGLGGQIGIEYNFNTHGVPLMLGLDTRPMWRFVGFGNGGPGYGAALSLRYTF